MTNDRGGDERVLTRLIKRGVDVIVSAFALIVAAPVITLVTAAIRVTMGAPVFFLDERAGRHGRPFTLLKFRTMRHPSRPGVSTPADEEHRITRLGRLLRRSSLDELPQLWNVLRGEMSLVGPRPLPTRYLPRYSTEQQRRHEVTPGITGWAQVNGRNTLTWDERLALDVWYVDHWRLGLDVRIIARTVEQVLLARDTTARNQEIMEEFRGIRSR